MAAVTSSSVPPDEPPSGASEIPPPAASRKPARKRRWLLQFLAVVVCGIAAGMGIAAAIHVPRVDAIANFSPKLVTQIYDREQCRLRVLRARAAPHARPGRDPAAAARRPARRRGRQLLPPRRHRRPRHRPFGAGQSAQRAARPGRFDDHHAARPEALPDRREELAAQDLGGVSRRRAREAALQAADPRDVLQCRLSRPRKLRHGERGALLFRSRSRGADAARRRRRSPASFSGRASSAPSVTPTGWWRGATTCSIGCSPRASSPIADRRQAIASPAGGRPHPPAGGARLRSSPRTCASTSRRSTASTGFITKACRSRPPSTRESRARPSRRCAADSCGWITGAASVDRSCVARNSTSKATRSRRSPAATRFRTPGSLAWSSRAAAKRHAYGPRKERSRSRRPGSPGPPGGPRPRSCASATSPGSVARRIRSARRRSYWRLEQEPEVEGAVVVLESATGALRAMVGGWDFRRSRFNRANQALRQVGSSFKPFVFGAALENGFTAADTLVRCSRPVSRRRRSAHLQSRGTTTAGTTAC